MVNDYVLGRAEAVAAEIRATGGRAVAVQADVSDLESVKAMVAKGAAEDASPWITGQVYQVNGGFTFAL